MRTLTLEKLSENVGAEILDVDVDRLLHDEDLPGACLDALEQYGVLLFRELHADDDAQVAFGRKLGPLRAFPDVPPAAEEVMEVSVSTLPTRMRNILPPTSSGTSTA